MGCRGNEKKDKKDKKNKHVFDSLRKHPKFQSGDSTKSDESWLCFSDSQQE